MKTWKKYTLLNVAGVLGTVASLFVVPEDTRLWMWAVISSFTLALLNYTVFRSTRANCGSGAKCSSAIIVVGVVVLFSDVALAQWHVPAKLTLWLLTGLLGIGVLLILRRL
jgi:hypothetical protein